MSHTRKIADNTVVHRLVFRQRNLLPLICLGAALLVVGLLPQSSYAVVANRYLYVVDRTAAQVEGFSITRTTGALLSLGACANLPAGVAPTAEANDPTGSFLYVSDSGGNQILGYLINPLTGCLAPIGAFATIGANPGAVHVTEDGRYVFVSVNSVPAGAVNPVAAVEGFQINPGGALVHTGGVNPFAYGANQAGLAFDSVGPYLYAADDSAPNGPIVPLEYNPFAAGALVPAPGCPGPCPTFTPNPTAMSVSSAGENLLALSAGGVTLDSYTINTFTGAVVFAKTLPLAAGPHSVYVDPFGRFGYVSNAAAATVQPYTIAPGGVIAVNGKPVLLPPGSNPAGLRVDETGKFLYIALPGTSQIAGFTINAITGRIAPIAASPWNTFVPAAGPTAVHGITP